MLSDGHGAGFTDTATAKIKGSRWPVDNSPRGAAISHSGRSPILSGRVIPKKSVSLDWSWSSFALQILVLSAHGQPRRACSIGCAVPRVTW